MDELKRALNSLEPNSYEKCCVGFAITLVGGGGRRCVVWGFAINYISQYLYQRTV